MCSSSVLAFNPLMLLPKTRRLNKWSYRIVDLAPPSCFLSPGMCILMGNCQISHLFVSISLFLATFFVLTHVWILNWCGYFVALWELFTCNLFQENFDVNSSFYWSLRFQSLLLSRIEDLGQCWFWYSLVLKTPNLIDEVIIYFFFAGTIMCCLTSATHLSSLTWTLTLAVTWPGFSVMHRATVAQR